MRFFVEEDEEERKKRLVSDHNRAFSTTPPSEVGPWVASIAGGVVGGLITAGIIAKICVLPGDLQTALTDLVNGYQHPALPTSMNFTPTMRDDALGEAQDLLVNLQPGQTVIAIADFQANILALTVGQATSARTFR